MNKIGVTRRFGFAIVPNPVLEDRELDTLSKMVYVSLCKFADTQRTAYPAIETIAKMCSCSARSVKRKIDELVKKGYIEKKVRYDKETNKQQSNLYLLNDVPFNDVERFVEKIIGVTQSHPPRDTESPTPMTQSHPPRDTESPKQYQYNNTNITNIYTRGAKAPKAQVPVYDFDNDNEEDS